MANVEASNYFQLSDITFSTKLLVAKLLSSNQLSSYLLDNSKYSTYIINKKAVNINTSLSQDSGSTRPRVGQLFPRGTGLNRGDL